MILPVPPNVCRPLCERENGWAVGPAVEVRVEPARTGIADLGVVTSLQRN